MLHKLLQFAGGILGKNKLSILIYHQVLNKHDPMRPNEPTKEIFDWHMRLLNRYFTPLSLDDALKHLKENSLPKNAICITFDDGYLNNLTIAQPILAKYNIPATVYVSTAFSHGQNMWNDRLIYLFTQTEKDTLMFEDERITLGNVDDRRSKAYEWLKKLKYLPINERLNKISHFYLQNNIEEQASLMMTPLQVKELANKGVTIGAHTINHPILKVMSEVEQYEEIIHSKTQLEQWIAQPVKHFAYPNGVKNIDFDDTTVQLVKDAGFESAVITNWGTSTHHTSTFLLKRFTPWDATPLKFHIRLTVNYFKSGSH